MSIEINNESGAEVDEPALLGVARFVLDAMDIDPLAELSIVLLDADSMAALHQQWMDLPGPTDVMAFPMDGDELPPDAGDAAGPGAPREQAMEALLGDVVLCPQVAAEQARTAGHSTRAELALLTAHGILHLLGYDHADADTEREMFELQARILREYTAESRTETIHTPVPGTEGQQRSHA